MLPFAPETSPTWTPMPCKQQLTTIGPMKLRLQQGFTMMMELASLPVTELPTMLKNLACGTIPANVAFPYLSCLCLHGFHAWINYHLMHGQELDAGSYIGTVMDCWTEHVMDLANATESPQDDVKSHPHLMKLSDWETHNEQRVDFQAQHCNLMTGVPLTYVLHESVMPCSSFVQIQPDHQ